MPTMSTEDKIIENLLDQIDALKVENAALEGAGEKVVVTMLDYGAGNVRSVRNAIQKVRDIYERVFRPELRRSIRSSTLLGGL